MSFNEILSQERKRRGLSQEDLAGMVNVSRQAVSKWETGDAMPDLPKLLALADALDISLDVLCGREPPPVSAPQPVAPAPRKGVLLLSAVCILLFVLLLGAVILLFSLSAPTTPTPPLLSTTEVFTVSGLGFHGKSNEVIGYQFTPSISGEDLSYRIIFTDSTGKSISINAPCSGGVCSGEVVLDSGYFGYAVSVGITDGAVTRSVAVANNLNFSQGSASWTPINS